MEDFPTRLICLTKRRGDCMPLTVSQCHSGPTSLPTSACIRMRSEDSTGGVGEGDGDMGHREAWLGGKRKVAHPEDQHFSILQPGIRAATEHDGHSSWGPAFCLPTTHGGPCLWGAWPVWL